MKIWRTASPLLKAILISCLIHALFAAVLIVQSDWTAAPPETTELYEMDLTQPAPPSQAELPANKATDLTSAPDTPAETTKPEKPPQSEPPKSSVTTPPTQTPAAMIRKPIAAVVTKRNIQVPTVIKTVDPLYPEAAAREKQPFKLTLAVQILDSGQPGVIAIVQSSGTNDLDAAAVAALQQWVFSPAIDLTTGKAIPFFATIDMSYPSAKNTLPPQQQGVNP
jgi:protein TonB